MTTAAKYIETLIEEKDLDLDATFSVDGPSGWNLMSYRVVTEAIASAPAHEQEGIAHTLRRIDFANGDVCHFFRHLAKALAA